MNLRSLSILLAVAMLCSACASGYRPPVVRPLQAPPRVLTDSFRVDQPRKTSTLVVSRALAPQDADAPGRVEVTTVDDRLRLDDVLRSVEDHFPDLVVARLEIDAAEARLLGARGAFDTTVGAQTKNAVQGFYQYEVFDFGVEQPLEEWGATVRAGYRFGLGDLASYDGDIETNAGGEFLIGFDVPLLKGRDIDDRRARLYKAELERDRALPQVQQKRLDLIRKASATYWKVVAAARAIDVAEDLLDLARTRRDSLAESVAAGELPEIVLADNDGLVVQREAFVVAARRKFERSSIVLSLYHRDENGDPIRVTPDELPEFPTVPAISTEDLEAHVGFGLEYRPELKILEYDSAAAEVERAKRLNELLPKLDFFALTSQDIGASTSSSSVDDQFELVVGAKFEIPLQRRRARGGLAAAKTKLAQLGEKARLQADRIEGEIRDAASALRRARERLVLTRRAAELASVLERAENDRLLEGQSDLLRVNLREQTAAKTRTDVIKAQAECLIGLTDYQAALGLPGPPDTTGE